MHIYKKIFIDTLKKDPVTIDTSDLNIRKLLIQSEKENNFYELEDEKQYLSTFKIKQNNDYFIFFLFSIKNSNTEYIMKLISDMEENFTPISEYGCVEFEEDKIVFLKFFKRITL